MGKNSELWRYWSIFLDKVMPVVINLTQSFRDADRELHLSAIRRAMPLIFAFGQINYYQRNYIASKCKICNPDEFIYMITGVTLPDKEIDNLFNCIERDEKHYLEYQESRTIDKSKSLSDTISLK